MMTKCLDSQTITKVNHLQGPQSEVDDTVIIYLGNNRAIVYKYIPAKKDNSDACGDPKVNQSMLHLMEPSSMAKLSTLSPVFRR